MTGSHKDIVTNSESDTRVLVAIPTLFTRDTLRNEIEGLERQTIPPDKILLITPKGDIGKDWEEFLAGRKKVELVYLDNYTREEVLSKIKDSRIDARNYALHRATHEFKDDDIIVFLDDDCPLDANWIEVAISNLKADGVGGFMGKTIHYRDYGKLRSLEETGLNIIKYLFGTNRVGTITNCGYVSSSFENPGKTEVDHLLGASMAYKVSAVRGLLFDGEYKGNCYREETDFCVRVGKNWKLIYDPSTTAHHYVGITRRDSSSMYYKNFNHIYFWKKNYKFNFCFFAREAAEALLLLGASILSLKTDYLAGIKGKIDAYRKFLLNGK